MALQRRSCLLRWADGALVVLFLAAITVPALTMAPHEATLLVEQTEQRPAAPFPQIEFRKSLLINRPRKESMIKFSHAFESWWNDHLGFRRELLQGYKLAKIFDLIPEVLDMPRPGQAARCPVIIGKKGYLFFSGERLMEDYRRTNPFTEAELERWKTVLEERRDWLARRGIHYVMFIAPNAQTIYPEYMPRSITRVRDQSRFDQLLAYLRQTSDLNVLDPRAALTEAKKQYPTYFQTDTHWNDFGALIGYQQLIKEASRWFPQAQPRTLMDYDVTVRDGKSMILAKWLDAPVKFHERNVVSLAPKYPLSARLAAADPSSPYQAPVLIPQGESVFVNPKAPLPNAVFVHDSFCMALAPYMNAECQRIHYVWTPNFPAEVIEQERPAIVFQEMVERGLHLFTPENPPQVVAEEEWVHKRKPSPENVTVTHDQPTGKAETTITVASSANPSFVGRPITFTATVSVPASAAIVPTGYVDFLVDGGMPLTKPLDASGRARLVVSTLAPGWHTISAYYAGKIGGGGDSQCSPSAHAVLMWPNQRVCDMECGTEVQVSQAGKAARGGQ